MERVRSVGDEPRRMRESDVFQEAFAASDYVPGLRQEGLMPGEGRIDFSLTLQDGLFNPFLERSAAR